MGQRPRAPICDILSCDIGATESKNPGLSTGVQLAFAKLMGTNHSQTRTVRRSGP